MEQVGDVSTEDFTDMRAAMNPGTGQRMIGSSTSKQQKALEDKESSLHKAMNLEVNWTQAYKDSQKKCKGSLGSMAAELHNCDTLLRKIAALPDTSEMKPLLQKQVQSQKKCLEDEKKKVPHWTLGLSQDLQKRGWSGREAGWLVYPGWQHGCLPQRLEEGALCTQEFLGAGGLKQQLLFAHYVVACIRHMAAVLFTAPGTCSPKMCSVLWHNFCCLKKVFAASCWSF